MAFDFDTVVPWGRSMDEYVAMFALSGVELESSILDCGGGPASFNAEMTRNGHQVISCDPLYAYGVSDIERRVEETYVDMVRSMETARDRFVWDYLGSPTQVGKLRMDAMRRFLDDYELGRAQERYVIGELPTLPFEDDAFELALCSHLLFLYADQLSLQFHQHSVRELLRVARQLRIFPLLDLQGECSAHLAPIISLMERLGTTVQVRYVDYEFQRDGNQMLVANRG